MGTRTIGKTKRLIGAVIAVLISLFIVFMAGTEPVLSAYAADLTLYDKTQIEDDLKGVDLSAYSKNEAGAHRLLDDTGFMEYGYSLSATIAKKYYGIYFYVYNPTEKAVSNRIGANVVNMAVEYDDAGNPTKYSNLSLTLLDKTEDNRIYKFRLTNGDGAYSRAVGYAEKHGGERRYDVGSIQLWFAGENNATDSYVGVGKDGTDGVAYTYYCTGYSKGCGADPEAESTLETRKEELKALRLDVHHTYFRPEGINGKTVRTQDSLSSVYFAVPKDIVHKYGEMSRIRGQYLRALTNEILVTGNELYYKKFKNQIGKDLGYTGGADKKYLSLKTNDNKIVNTPYTFETYYNSCVGGKDYIEHAAVRGAIRYFSTLYYVFFAENKNADEYDLASEILIQYMEDYTKEHPVSEESLVGGFSPDLFKTVEDSFTYFDISDEDFTQELTEMKLSQSGWDKFWGIKRVIESTAYDGKESIHRVNTKRDFVFDGNTLNAEETSKKLYVAESDVGEFYEYCKQREEDSYVYLIRFAVDDYESSEMLEGYNVSAKTDYSSSDNGEKIPSMMFHFMEDDDSNCYLAQEYVYLDFEIIDLSFTKNGVTTVIPVVMSPIDIIADITHPLYTNDDAPSMKILWYMLGVSVASLAGGITQSVVLKKTGGGNKAI